MTTHAHQQSEVARTGANPRLVFLISLPRSGSTLLQRLLASHPNVSTTAEPWILLPLVYMTRAEGACAEYGHSSARQGLLHLISSLPGQEESYQAELARFIHRLYGRVSETTTEVFVDKTPRYSLIAAELAAIFPEARFVYLFRNPLGVMSSYLTVMRGDSLLRWDHSRLDLEVAPHSLVRGLQAAGERALVVSYEDLLRDTQQSVDEIYTFLGLKTGSMVPPRPSRLDVPERLGDAASNNLEKVVDQGQVWRERLRSPTRRRLARRFIDSLPDEYLAAGGYNRTDLQAMLVWSQSEWPDQHVVRDYWEAIVSTGIAGAKAILSRFARGRFSTILIQ